MNDKRKGLLFQTKKQMNNGAIATGLGFVLYLALLAMGLELPADLVAVAFGVVGIFNSFSVLEGRRRDKENISYNLLWGQLALTIFLVACAALASGLVGLCLLIPFDLGPWVQLPELPYWCGVLHGLALLALVPIIASKAQKFSPAFYKRRRSPEAAPLAALRRARNAPILTKAQEGGKGGTLAGGPPLLSCS